MNGFIEKMKDILKTIGDFFSSLFNRRRKRNRRASIKRTSNRRAAALGQSVRKSERKRSARRRRFSKATIFFKRLWDKVCGAFSAFVNWLTHANRKVVYGFTGGVSIGIITIVVIISVLVTPFADAQAGNRVDDSNITDVPAAVQLDAAAAKKEEGSASKTADDITVLIFKSGMEHSYVANIQERLMELDYMEDDLPTELYGDTTSQAVSYFQRKNNLEVTGIADAITLAKLFSEDASAYTVSLGDDGYDVTELQTRLVELGYIDKITGHYGEETKEAVKRFQNKNGLTSDGNVGAKTMEMLYSEDATANFLSYGEKSDAVKKYQQKLKQLGYLSTEPDGTYGSNTVAAVKRFQTLNGLIADGFLGPTTKELLDKGTGKPNALILGVSGDDVTKMQQRLVELKYLRSATGYFGSDTENAIKNFQKRNWLTVDGKAGINTLNKLYSSSARKASSSTGSSSSSSSSSKPSSGSSSGGTVSYNKSVSSLLAVAKSKLGCRYVLGGKGPNTFDCSGFVWYCLQKIGVNQSYWTSSGWRGNGKYQKISSMGSIKAGDIVVFGNGLNHVGIALGGGQMIDASSNDGKIRITSLSKSYWKNHFYAAYRVLG